MHINMILKKAFWKKDKSFFSPKRFHQDWLENLLQDTDRYVCKYDITLLSSRNLKLKLNQEATGLIIRPTSSLMIITECLSRQENTAFILLHSSSSVVSSSSFTHTLPHHHLHQGGKTMTNLLLPILLWFLYNFFFMITWYSNVGKLSPLFCIKNRDSWKCFTFWLECVHSYTGIFWVKLF